MKILLFGGVLIREWAHIGSFMVVQNDKKFITSFNKVATNLENMENLENSGNLKNCQISWKTQGNFNFCRQNLENSGKMKNT